MITTARQLSDSNFYQELHHDPTEQFKQQIKRILHLPLHNQQITPQEYLFMLVDYPIITALYILPKIHKSYTLTENISAFVFDITFLHSYNCPGLWNLMILLLLW